MAGDSNEYDDLMKHAEGIVLHVAEEVRLLRRIAGNLTAHEDRQLRTSIAESARRLESSIVPLRSELDSINPDPGYVKTTLWPAAKAIGLAAVTGMALGGIQHTLAPDTAADVVRVVQINENLQEQLAACGVEIVPPRLAASGIGSRSYPDTYTPEYPGDPTETPDAYGSATYGDSTYSEDPTVEPAFRDEDYGDPSLLRPPRG